MPQELVTKEDLHILRLQLIEDIRILVAERPQMRASTLEGLKTKQVRKALDCSINKLTQLRISGAIRYKKIGGTLYYNKEDVDKLINDGY